jgi:hypothetical protein
VTVNQDYVTQSQGIIDAMGTDIAKLSQLRQKHSKAKIVFERAQESVLTVRRDRTIALANSDVVKDSVDPRTGKSNAEWAKLLVEAMLATDAELMAEHERFTKAQEAIFLAETDMLEVAERVGVLKSQARLLGDLLAYVADAA